MTVQTETSRSGPYAGSGTTGPFTVGFRFLDNSHLQVIRTSATGIDTTLAITTDYTVSGAGGASGTVTLVTALATGERLTIIRDVPFTQLADYVDNDAFPAESHENALDLLTMQTQQNREVLARSLTLPATVAGVSTELPSPESNKLIGWNEAADALQNMDSSTLATIVAYGTAASDLFDGDGTTTQFTLSSSPGALNNLDVSVGGVTQRPGVDYAWSAGTTVTFVAAPPVGTDNILVRYMQALPQGTADAAAVTYTPAGTGAVATDVQSKLRESVSVKDFGAVGDGVTNDNVAIQLALNSGATSVYFPSGTYNISGITVPSAVKAFYGDGENVKFVGVGAPAAYAPFINFNAMTGFDVHGFSIDVDRVTYPTNHALYFGSCGNGRVRDIHVIDGGYMGVYAPGCFGVTFKDIQIAAYSVAGFRADTSPSNLTLDNVQALSAGASHSIQIIGGAGHKIVNSKSLASGATVFGISLLTCMDSIIANNNCTTSTVEGINIQDSSRVSIISNTVYCTAGHNDFGISVFGSLVNTSHNLVEGNRVYFSGKAGIALASSAAIACKQNHIIGNLVVSPNQLNEAHWGGVTLYGSTLCSENTVQANRLIDEGSTAKYGVNEYNDGGGNPQYNYFIDNPVLTASGLVSQSKILTAFSQAWDVAKTTFTPTITASAGSITTATGGGSYRPRGKFVEVDLSITVTTNGTGSGALVATTPLTTIVNGALNGRENTTSGAQVNGIGSGASIQIRKYDNSYPAANGSTFQLSGILEIA